MSSENPGDVAGDILDQNSRSREIGPAAVASQLLLMSALGFVTLIAFNLLRPKNKVCIFLYVICVMKTHFPDRL